VVKRNIRNEETLKMVDMFERSKLKLTLCEVLKTDYVALLAQKGIGASTLVTELLQSQSPVTGMKFVFTPLPRGIEKYEDFMQIYIQNLVKLCSQLYGEKPANLEQLTVDLRLRTVIDYLEEKTAERFLVIVLQDLADSEQEPLKKLLLILREYHEQINEKKIRFLLVGGNSLWKLCSGKNSYNESPFNIAKRVYIGGLSYRDVSGYLPDLTLKQQAILLSLTDGVPSLVNSRRQEEDEDISHYFADIQNRWWSLSSDTQNALISIIESQQQLPKCKDIDYECPQIPILEKGSIWEEAFWMGFIRIRHKKLVWRSPLHQAFVATQTNSDFDSSRTTLLKSNLEERSKQLESIIGKPLTDSVLKECAEELMFLAPQKDNEKVVSILEMILEGNQNEIISNEIKKINLLSFQENITSSNFKQNLCKEIFKIVFNADLIKITENILKINITSKSVSFNYKGTEYKSPNQLSDSSFAQELLSLETSPEKYGEKLFEAIFNSKSLEIGGKFTPTLVGFSELSNSEIKIELAIDEDITLHQYPWELLRNSNTKFWLAVQKNCPFYRRHGDCKKDPISSKPLNILIVICNPKSETNQIIKNLPPIEVEKETEFLKSIFDPLVEQKIINYNILEKGTWKNLESALNEEKYHVVHLIGHGGYIDKKFSVIMDGENEKEWFITADKFNQNLRLNPLQLLVLISCEGGSFNDKFGTKGLGPTLVDKGIPYVVAMQEPVSFYEAQQFSQLFYKYLTEYRYVDIAMALTRSALQQDLQLNLGNEWAIPVLFMGTDRGELFS
jgi:hypothetical protein